MSKSYSVVWEINIDATTPLEAVHFAIEMQRDIYSEALCFEVTEDATGIETFIDWMENNDE
jgi:hypothetical protein